MKPFVIISGMHRSGTSFLSRAFNIAGVYLGELDDVTTNEWYYNKDNLRGHWENRKFVEIADETLTLNNGSWDNIPKKITITQDLGKKIAHNIKKLSEHPSLAT